MAATHGRKGRPWRRIREQILQASDLCWLCGLPGADSVDHVVPLSVLKATGRMDLANSPANLRPAHVSCNSRRQDRVPTPRQTPSRTW